MTKKEGSHFVDGDLHIDGDLHVMGNIYVDGEIVSAKDIKARNLIAYWRYRNKEDGS